MIVYYRMCSLKSRGSKPSPIYAGQPLKLHRLCLESFVSAFEGTNVKVVFLCAFCNKEYDELIKELTPFEHEIIHTTDGINESCLHQYDLYKKSDEDKVMFLEYDYYWTKAGGEIITAVNNFDFVTPYDHLDKYETETKPIVEVFNGRHWKQTISTTATFATTAEKFYEYEDLLYKWGYLDHDRWVEMGQKGAKLYSPIPSIATHMVTDYLSPHVDWPF